MVWLVRAWVARGGGGARLLVQRVLVTVKALVTVGLSRSGQRTFGSSYKPPL